MRRALALPLVPLVVLLAGCAPTVSMTPAPQATSARCAGLIVRLPQTLGDAGRRATDAQATAAWGTPASVTLTCGVTTPAVADTTCTTVGGIDWLLETRTLAGVERRVLTTYGRDPGTQVVVDPRTVDPATALDALAEPLATATGSTGRRCLAVSDAAS
jgi:hypothetical protein